MLLTYKDIYVQEALCFMQEPRIIYERFKVVMKKSGKQFVKQKTNKLVFMKQNHAGNRILGLYQKYIQNSLCLLPHPSTKFVFVLH